MTDRELLEAAAKAARIPLRWGGIDGDVARIDDEMQLWNPLADDGDALRLAITLRMQVRVEDYGAAARINDGGWSQFEAHIYGGIEAATRRAIVRAAAAIGHA